MSKQVLDIEQMKHLQKLGLDTSRASMCWWRRIRDFRGEKVEGKWSLSFNKPHIVQNFEQNEDIPTFILQDILDLLPKELGTDTKRYNLDMWYGIYINKWCVGYIYGEDMYCDDCFTGDNLIDASYEMLCWCIENGYVKTNKKG